MKLAERLRRQLDDQAFMEELVRAAEQDRQALLERQREKEVSSK